jgi:ribosomal protein S18 acetylase RimI-like enzyme
MPLFYLICAGVNAKVTSMQDVTIRAATTDDIQALARLWHEKAVVQQQSDSRLRLLADGESRWAAAAADWLTDLRCRIVVGERADGLVGYVVGWIEDNPPGLAPERAGVVRDMAVGLHSYQSGLGRMLLDGLKAWFAEQGITHVLAHVPRRQPVEQAFWRALGATELTEVMWMKVESGTPR